MRKASSFLALFLVLILSACASVRETAEIGRPGPVILVSIDGFRADYLDRGLTPNLSALAARGARGAMRPSFPSKTFPNHYTLVTGLRPDRHGLVDNTMVDPDMPGRTFVLGDAREVTDPAWWDEATPIWVSAERAGRSTAIMFWPGSEAPIHGVLPGRYRKFDQSLSADVRVDQVLAWLDAAPAERPDFLALYFDEVDTYGHWHGPDSAQVNAALSRTDAAIGRLVDGLEARGLLERTDIVVVSDHGMSATSRDRVILLDGLVGPEDGRAVVTGPYLAFAPSPERQAAAEAALLRDHEHMQCWRKGELPARFAYGRHRRVPALFCLGDDGWEILPRASAERRPQAGGAHGYDPAHLAMASIFVAAGPSFRAGVRLSDFDNVDVYPLLTRLLAVEPEPNDGDLLELAPALRR